MEDVLGKSSDKFPSKFHQHRLPSFEITELTTLCNGLVCNRPFSPMFVFHTMSSFPILVTPFRTFGSFKTFGTGVKQYKYCCMSRGFMKVYCPSIRLSLLKKTKSYLMVLIEISLKLMFSFGLYIFDIIHFSPYTIPH